MVGGTLSRIDNLIYHWKEETILSMFSWMQSMKQPVIYITLLKELMEAHDLIGSLEQIYNVHESGMHLDPKAPNVVAKIGAKKVRY